MKKSYRLIFGGPISFLEACHTIIYLQQRYGVSILREDNKDYTYKLICTPPEKECINTTLIWRLETWREDNKNAFRIEAWKP